MLVDVVRMRFRGERLPAAELKTQVPVRGVLSVRSRLGRSTSLGKQEHVTVAMLLHPGEARHEGLLPLLDFARLTRVQDMAFVLNGFEEVEIARQPRDYFQAWWCRLVLPAGVAAPAYPVHAEVDADLALA